VGESLIVSGLLRTIRNEISPDAAHKKLLQIYEGVEECCYCLVELSHDLFDVDVWQHYKVSGYESFDAYCTEVLKISAEKAERLKLIRDRMQKLPGHKASPGDRGRAICLSLVLSQAKTLGFSVGSDLLYSTSQAIFFV
jgi:hypothetical protein